MSRSRRHTPGDQMNIDDMSRTSLTSDEWEILNFVEEMVDIRVGFMRQREADAPRPEPVSDISSARAMVAAAIDISIRAGMTQEETLKVFRAQLIHATQQPVWPETSVTSPLSEQGSLEAELRSIEDATRGLAGPALPKGGR